MNLPLIPYIPPAPPIIRNRPPRAKSKRGGRRAGAGHPPWGYYWRDIIMKELEIKDVAVEGQDRRIQGKVAVVKAIKRKAVGGDLKAAEMLMERVDGKVVQPTELSGPGGGPIPIEARSINVIVEYVRPQGKDGNGSATPGGNGQGQATGKV